MDRCAVGSVGGTRDCDIVERLSVVPAPASHTE